MTPTGHNAVRAADIAAVHLRPWSPRWSSRQPQSLGRPPTPGSQQRSPDCANDNLLTKTTLPKKVSDLSKLEPLYRLGRSRAAMVCDGPAECNIRALMAFEGFTSSYAHGLRRTFDRVSSNPTSQKLQPPPRGCMGPKVCRNRRNAHFRMAERPHLPSEKFSAVLRFSQ